MNRLASATRGAAWLVASREITTRTRTRAFRFTTVAMMLAILAAILIARYTNQGPGSATVGFAPSVSTLEQQYSSLMAAVNQPVTVSTVDQTTGEQQVRDGTLDALVTGTPESLQVMVDKEVSPTLHDTLTVLARQSVLSEQISALGGDPTAVAAAVDRAGVQVVALNPPRQYQTQRLIIGVIVGILLFIALSVYGQSVAGGVVEEKSSRVVELLLSTVRPWQLMLGKVVGIGLVGLTQLVLVGGVGVVVGLSSGVLTIPPQVAAGLLVWAVVWFLLGFTIYALMFAAVGALVSRQEEVGGVAAPMMMLLAVPYILGAFVLPSHPDNTVLQALSVVPFFAPIMMMVRLALGGVPVWQVALSLLLTAATLVAMVRLTGRIYANAVLRTGGRVRVRDALRTSH
ncbi:MAG TPA: ABC transporter permease [Micromonosporaceae bacterium]